MRTNYVLIDYESVQPEDVAVLDEEHFRVMLFVGAHQPKLLFKVVTAVHRLGARAELIEISGNGPNALDFHIAFYIGQLAAAEPNAYFHIISKDKGFDPLIQHLKSKKIFAAREKRISDIPLVKTSNSKAPERLEIVVAKLHRLKFAKPRTLETLKSTIHSLFQKQLSDSEIMELLKALQSKGMVTVGNKKLTYKLPAVQS